MSGAPARGQYWAPSRSDYKLAFLIVGIPVVLALALFAFFSLMPGSVDGESLGKSVAGEFPNSEYGDEPCDQLKGKVWRCRLDDTNTASGSRSGLEFEVTVDGECWDAVQIKRKNERGKPFEGCVKLIDGL